MKLRPLPAMWCTPEFRERCGRASSTTSDMSCAVNRRHDSFSREHERLSCGEEGGATPKWERDAREMAATMRSLLVSYRLSVGRHVARMFEHEPSCRLRDQEPLMFAGMKSSTRQRGVTQALLGVTV